MRHGQGADVRTLGAFSLRKPCCAFDHVFDDQPMITMPRKPSTVTVSPVRITSVAAGTPVTQGMPYSRAMIAP